MYLLHKVLDRSPLIGYLKDITVVPDQFYFMSDKSKVFLKIK